MSDRVAAFVVVLDGNMAPEEAAATLAALARVKGVLSVEPVASDMRLLIAQSRAAADIEERLLRSLREPLP